MMPSPHSINAKIAYLIHNHPDKFGRELEVKVAAPNDPLDQVAIGWIIEQAVVTVYDMGLKLPTPQEVEAWLKTLEPYTYDPVPEGR